LKGYGISGNFLEWIKNFLSECKQKVGPFVNNWFDSIWFITGLAKKWEILIFPRTVGNTGK
jgi:hypothetical protein